MRETRHAITVEGTCIAVRHLPAGRATDRAGLVWLGGFRSSMDGTKANALAAMAAGEELSLLRHDYSGHGESGGAFEAGTISRWLAESLAVFDRFTDGPQVLVGSSMGAWIALRMVQELANRGDGARIAGLLVIAPAPDFTTLLRRPALTPEQENALMRDGRIELPSRYDDGPYVYTRALFEDGEVNRVLTGPLDTHCPVHIIHGTEDADVPLAHGLRLMEHLPADNVTLSIVRGGDHRLSRDDDLRLILASALRLAGSPGA
ncbi:MAG: alpha/beta hydrolase [Notoacmeibacter sp.]|nr:alpha/beta hydrolase [Notoacmeibacter sp.]